MPLFFSFQWTDDEVEDPSRLSTRTGVAYIDFWPYKLRPTGSITPPSPSTTFDACAAVCHFETHYREGHPAQDSQDVANAKTDLQQAIGQLRSEDKMLTENECKSYIEASGLPDKMSALISHSGSQWSRLVKRGVPDRTGLPESRALRIELLRQWGQQVW